MKQYVFYDRKTGAVRHVHQVVSAESRRPIEVSPKELAGFVERMVDLEGTRSLYAEVPTTSSRAAVRHVDVKSGRLVTRRLSAREQERARRSAE